MLEKFLHEHREIIELDYVDLKIDLTEMDNGEAVAKRLRKERNGGIPWMVILDVDGSELISSDGPDGNCGYPLTPAEVGHFVTMLQKTTQRMKEPQIAKLKKSLDDYRAKREKGDGRP